MADVRVTAPDGTTGTVPESDLQYAIEQGYTVEPTAQDKYADQGGRALLEGVGRGATLGASDYVQGLGANIGTRIGNYLADQAGIGETQRATARGVNAGVEDIDRSDQAIKAEQEAKADILGRKEANAGLATVGEIGGAIGLGVLTGGLGTEAAAARMGLAGVESVAGRAAVAGLKGAAEGALYGAAKAVDDDFLSDHEITAERIMLGAGEGALFGGAFGAGGSLVGSGAKAASKKVSDFLGGTSAGSYLDDLAGESAYKAVVGRTSKKAIAMADRHGGAKAVGETLLEEGLIGGSAESQLARIAQRADEIGEEIGRRARELDELGHGGPSKSGLKNAIEEQVLAKLKEGTFTEGTEATVRARLGRLMDNLSTAERPVLVRGKNGPRELTRDVLSFDEMRAIRMELDNELANWNTLTADKGPLKAYRDVRRVMEDYWLDAAEEASAKAGKAGFKEEFKALKTKFARLALARDEAQEAVTTQLANRATSLTDTIAGAGMAAATGGMGAVTSMASGALTSQAHRFIRERGRGWLANAIYNARKSAVRGEQAIEKASTGFLAARKIASRVAGMRPGTVPLAGVVMNANKPESITNGIQKLSMLADPMSKERADVRERFSGLAMESPEHAAALEGYTQRSAEFLLMRAPRGGIDLSVPFGHTKPPKYQKREVESFMRAVRAVQNPSAALARIADGTWSQEDLDAIKALQPRAWARFVANVSAQIADAKKPPSYSERLRMSRALGIPMTAFETASFQHALAQSNGMHDQASAEESNASQPSYTSAVKLANATSNLEVGSERAVSRGQQ